MTANTMTQEEAETKKKPRRECLLGETVWFSSKQDYAG